MSVATFRGALYALILDGDPHPRSELNALAAAHGLPRRQVVLAVQASKDAGVYIASDYDPAMREWVYYDAHTPDMAEQANQRAIARRALPEHIRRLRATRGEREVYVAKGRSTVKWDREIRECEVLLTVLASRAGQPVVTVLNATVLDPTEVASIHAEVAAGHR